MSYNKKEKKSQKKQQTKKLLIKKWVTVLAVVFPIALIISGVFIYLNFFAKPLGIKDNNNNANSEYSVSELANQTAAKGDYDGGQKIIDQEINNTVNDGDKVTLYIDKSILALNNQKYEDAYAFAQKAEDIAKSKLTGRLIAQIAEASGDKAKAIEYYGLTVSRYSEEEKNSDELALAYFEDLQKIKELQND